MAERQQFLKDTSEEANNVHKDTENSEHLITRNDSSRITTYGTYNHNFLINNFTIDKKCHRVILNDERITWTRVKKTTKDSKVSATTGHQEG